MVKNKRDRARSQSREKEGRKRKKDDASDDKEKHRLRSDDWCENRHYRRHNDSASTSGERPVADEERHKRRKGHVKNEPVSEDEMDHQRRERRENERKRIERRKQQEGSEFEVKSEFAWGKEEPATDKSEAQVEKEKPNFGVSGKLAADTNTFNGVVVKYNEPPEARKPKIRWRLYPFKGDESLPVLYIHRQSAYLVGRDRRVADIPVDHPSCSKQHAAIQYRVVKYERDDGSKGRRIKPYLIDLASANGTFLNNQRIEAQRYFELQEKDVVKFGFSSREYVLLHENSTDSDNDMEQVQ